MILSPLFRPASGGLTTMMMPQSGIHVGSTGVPKAAVSRFSMMSLLVLKAMQKAS